MIRDIVGVLSLSEHETGVPLAVAILLEDKTRSRNRNIVGALALLRAALLRIFHRLRPLYGSLPATLEVVRADSSIALNAIFRRLP